MLTAVARDQRWPDVVAGISARFSTFAFVRLGETMRFSENKIHRSLLDQSLSVKCFGSFFQTPQIRPTSKRELMQANLNFPTFSLMVMQMILTSNPP